MADRYPAIAKRTDHLPEDQKLQIQFALAAFGTLKAKEVAYISVPITSGRRLYDYMEAHGFKNQAEAKKDHDAFFKNVVAPNLADGVRGGDIWRQKIDGAVIAPAEFEKSLRSQKKLEWGQDTFMGMWVPLIEEKVTTLVLLDGWEYSNGSGEEYLQAVLMQMGRSTRSDIKIVDVAGRPMPQDKGIALVAGAFIRAHGLGLQPRNMAETLGLLLEAEKRYTTGDVPPYDRERVERIRDKMTKVFEKDYPDILPVLRETETTDYTPLNAVFRRQPKLRLTG